MANFTQGVKVSGSGSYKPINIPSVGGFVSRERPFAGTLFYDLFVDIDNTLLENHDPDIDKSGLGWESITGSIEIIGNEAEPQSLCRYTNDCGSANVINTAVSRVDNLPSYMGQVVRAVDSNNVWELRVSKNPANTIDIHEITGGVGTGRASTSFNNTAPEEVTTTATLSGNTITFNASKTGQDETISYTSTIRNTATKHGILSAFSVTTYGFTEYKIAEL